MWVATLGVWGAVIVAGVLTYYAYDLPDVDAAMAVDRRPGLTLVSADGKVIVTTVKSFLAGPT